MSKYRKRKTKHEDTVAVLTLVVECNHVPAEDTQHEIVDSLQRIGTVVEAELYCAPKPGRVGTIGGVEK